MKFSYEPSFIIFLILGVGMMSFLGQIFFLLSKITSCIQLLTSFSIKKTLNK